ncbi:MAG: type IV secretion system DNA-binding domain-containing protein [Candidatus Paceibacterota bacterium]|jgi:hypothetical protein
MDNDKINYFAETDYRNKKTRFGIKAKDRTKHVYIIGKTGMGKSTLLENMIAQDIMNGEGVAFIDPHGGSAEKMLDYVPEHRIKDVIYFAPFDIEYPISFNVMEDVGADKRYLVASGLMSSFKKIWVDAWSARMEYILNNILLALLEYPEATLLGVNRMLSDKDYRKQVVENVSDPSVKSFWVDEFAKYGDRYMQEAGAAIQNKIGQFTSNALIRNIIGQPKSSFNIREIMDEKKILIMNLSKGRVGEQNASLLGGMLITKIYLAAMSRADVSNEVLQHLPNFYFYVDEFQSFTSDSFADILSEARKYKLNLNIAHQYISQMSEVVRDAVFGNVGTTIAFRVGPLDAEFLEKIFLPTFTQEDIVNLGFAQIYLTMMIDGIGSKPFSAVTLPPLKSEPNSFKNSIIDNSREVFAKKREEVEIAIKGWHAPVVNERVKEAFAYGTKLAESRPEKRSGDYRDKGNKGDRDSFSSKTKKPFESLKDLIDKGEATLIPHEKTIYSKTPVSSIKADKIDPKRASDKNMSDLRSVLTEALKEREREEKSSTDSVSVNLPQKSLDQEKSKHSENKTEVFNREIKNEEKQYQEPISQSVDKKDQPKRQPKEIPEDVLRKILE